MVLWRLKVSLGQSTTQCKLRACAKFLIVVLGYLVVRKALPCRGADSACCRLTVYRRANEKIKETARTDTQRSDSRALGLTMIP